MSDLSTSSSGVVNVGIFPQSPVTSFNGRIGNIVPDCSDYALCYAPLGSAIPGGGTLGQVLAVTSTTPTFTVGWQTPIDAGPAAANTFFGNNTGSSATPSFQTISFTNIAGTLSDAQLPSDLSFVDPGEGGFMFLDEAQGKVLALKSINPTISADQNNWAPTGLIYADANDPGAFHIEVNGGAADRNITGLAGGYAGRIIRFYNDGTTNKIILKNLSGSSLAANQFDIGADIPLAPGESLVLVYSPFETIWEPFNYRAFTGGGGTFNPAADNFFTHSQSITIAPGANTIGFGLESLNTTPASNGNQQYSPFTHWQGQAWKSQATAASQPIDARIGLITVQGTAAPTGYLAVSLAVNNGSYTNCLNFFSSGGVSMQVTDPGTGYFNALTGIKIGGAATAGNVLRGNGTAFVSAQLAYADLASPLTFNDSIVNTSGTVNLVGDTAAPGNSMLYGTNASGVRGWYAQPSGGGTPGGSNTQVQYNNAGAFGGISSLTVDASANVFSTATRFFFDDPTDTTKQLRFDASNVSTGSVWVMKAPGTNSWLVLNNTGTTHHFLTSITNGVVADARPAAADLSDGLTGTGSVVMSNSPTLVTPNFTTGFTIGGAATTGNVARGNGTNFVSAQLAYSDLSGTPSIPASANPTATIGLSAVNGTASTFMTSDSAPPLSQAIAPTWTGHHIFNAEFDLSGTLSPAQLSADQNDWNPTGLSTAIAIRVDGGGSDRNITGLSGGADGRIIVIYNVGSTNNIILKNQSTSSASANRFLFGSDANIGVNKSLVLRYDGTSNFWRQFGRVLANTGVTAGSYGDATHIPSFTVDAAGVLSAASSNAVVFPANTNAVSHQFFTAYNSATGAFTQAQPAFGDISGTLAAGQFPALTGDVTTTAGSLTTTLGNIPDLTTQAGSILGTNIAAPSTPASGKCKTYFDSTSKNICSKNDAGTVNHGIQSQAGASHKWIASVADDGSSTISQPAAADLSDGTTGSSGAVVLAGSPTITTPSFTTGFQIGGAAASGNSVQGNGTNFVAGDYGAWQNVYYVTSSDSTTTGQTLTNITGLVSGTLSTSTLYEFEANIIASSSSAAGIEFGVADGGSGTGTAATVQCCGVSTGGSANGAATSFTLTSVATATAALYGIGGGTLGSTVIRGFFTTTSTGSPSLAIQFLKVTSGTATVKRGSVLKIRKTSI